MPPAEEVALQAAVLRRLESLQARLGPRLGGALGALSARLDLPGAASGPGYFLHPLALPVLQLPTWVAPQLDEERLLKLAEAAAVGYLHVRIQDDLLDEGVGDSPASMLLSDTLLNRHQRLLARIVGGQEVFWALSEARWASYAEAMLAERSLYSGQAPFDRSAFLGVLERSMPLALPPAAAAIAAGLEEKIPALEDFTRELALSHQLFTDLIDAERDLAAGNLTWVLRRAGARGGDPALERRAVRRALYLEGGFDEVLREAHSALEAAGRAASMAGLGPGCDRYLERRAALMERTRQRTLRGLLEALLSGDT